MKPEIVALQQRVEKARLAQARAQAAKEQAEKLRAEAIEALKTEFGLDNLEDARAKLEQLAAQKEAEMKKVSDLLEKIE